MGGSASVLSSNLNREYIGKIIQLLDDLKYISVKIINKIELLNDKLEYDENTNYEFRTILYKKNKKLFIQLIKKIENRLHWFQNNNDNKELLSSLNKNPEQFWIDYLAKCKKKYVEILKIDLREAMLKQEVIENEKNSEQKSEYYVQRTRNKLNKKGYGLHEDQRYLNKTFTLPNLKVNKIIPSLTDTIQSMI